MKVGSLTRREREIAYAYGGGAGYRDIAAQLFISPDTVRTHVRSIYRKLGVASKIELLKELERRTASAPQARAGHGLAAHVGQLREEALLALGDGMIEPKQGEPVLRASGLEFQTVIEALPAVILLKDQALRYVFANRFFLSQWGLRLENVVGRTQQEVFSGGLGSAWSRATDDRDARVLETGQATGFYVVRVPVEAACDRVLWARKLPLQNEEGSVSQVLTVGIDITPLERVPQEMRALVPSAEIPLPAPIAARLPHVEAGARILVVDAEPGVRQLAVEALERVGHTVETAASGREALAVLRKQQVDLIVSDIEMSDLDGPGLCHVLAARRSELLRRLIFTTRTNAPAELEGLGCEAGAEVLEKPFAAEDIVARVEAKLAGGTSCTPLDA